MRPIDHRGSNPARALGGLLLAAVAALAWVGLMGTALWLIAP